MTNINVKIAPPDYETMTASNISIPTQPPPNYYTITQRLLNWLTGFGFNILIGLKFTGIICAAILVTLFVLAFALSMPILGLVCIISQDPSYCGGVQGTAAIFTIGCCVVVPLGYLLVLMIVLCIIG